MNKDLFNKLFDRPTENPDFLRARIASVIDEINHDLLKNLKGNYNEAFYIATTSYCISLSKNFDNKALRSIYFEIKNFRSFLFKIFNFSETCTILKIEDYFSFFRNYLAFTRYCGYTERSRILRRYTNFIKVTEKFKEGKLRIQDYRKEILNHIIFFDDMLKHLSSIENNYEDLIIYLFVYDIRASRKVREQVSNKH